MFELLQCDYCHDWRPCKIIPVPGHVAVLCEEDEDWADSPTWPYSRLSYWPPIESDEDEDEDEDD